MPPVNRKTTPRHGAARRAPDIALELAPAPQAAARPTPPRAPRRRAGARAAERQAAVVRQQMEERRQAREAERAVRNAQRRRDRAARAAEVLYFVRVLLRAPHAVPPLVTVRETLVTARTPRQATASIVKEMTASGRWIGTFEAHATPATRPDARPGRAVAWEWGRTGRPHVFTVATPDA